MTKKEVIKTSEAEIAVHWQEENYYYPSNKFISQANMTDKNIYERFNLKNFPKCFDEYAKLLNWYKPWKKTLDTSNAPFWKWFQGGEINASYNCIDRHLKKNKNKTAIHFVPEPINEKYIHISYQELYLKVNELAYVLKNFCKLKKGDCITLYMPMVPELPITMLACARLGIIHSQVFSGFSGDACADRIIDSGSNILITMDVYYRNGKLLDHKKNADIAINSVEKRGKKINKMLIWQRYPDKYLSNTPMQKNRDFNLNNILKSCPGKIIKPEKMTSESPLFLMYTSGTTGKPKGCQHSTGGYLSYVAGTSKFALDIHPEDIYWCMADIGWITGHSYIVYGPLSICSSTVIYEGVPTFPDASRPWKISEDLNVNIFHTAPTTIRTLRKLQPEAPSKFNYHFKHMTTVGEPIEPEVWKWYYEKVGKKEAAIIDTWWQTETGGFLCGTLPGITPMKPGSTGPGMPGIHPIIYDDKGNIIPKGSGKAGNICIKNPWPGMFQTIWGNKDRFISTYYSLYSKNMNSKHWEDWIYLTGDAALESNDGYYRILGRIDDVINVSGHRLGTKEIESAVMIIPEIAEAAVVPVSHEIKGKEPDLYVSLKPGFKQNNQLKQNILKIISSKIGKIAKPRKIWIVNDMPKTRSGKIMRRILGAISNNNNVGDIMTLANPEIVEEIKSVVINDEKK